MGRDKATIRVGDKPLIRYTYDVVKRIFSRIMVVSSRHEAIEGVEARIVEDVFPISGSMTGIVSALLNSDTGYVFVVGCDMPFLNEQAIRYMIDEVNGEDILVPRTEGGLEPTHAIYNRSCISPMLTALERGQMKIRGVFDLLRVRILPVNSLFFNGDVSVFTNVNNQEDLERAKRALR
ncbi:MAG: putative molybdenum cofactor guanylyltransferase [Syntrophorhabdaceae bacterium PtaU1.Bin034]|nr:MAG: putative molybdenum cofactor guanylyltransferase [Syntrophorhabdaceae bacterium PtaU1.Bin034]